MSRTAARHEDHLVALPGTPWRVWRQAVLRTTGFPAGGLDRLCALDCAAAADAYLDEPAEIDGFEKAYHEAIGRGCQEIYEIAGDPLFREAITWQSRSVLPALDGLRAAGPEPVRNRKQRERERIVARYWQRYCAKTETVGFFGPVCWIELDRDAPAVSARPGPALTRSRTVLLEYWALTAYADMLCADQRVRIWVPPMVPAHLALAGLELIDPNHTRITLSPIEAAVLRRCDGRRPAMDLAAELVRENGSALHSVEDVYFLLGRLAARGLLSWRIDLPVSLDCEHVLRARLEAIGDDAARAAALAGLDRLCLARDDVAAAGDPDTLGAAMSRLEHEFTATTGREPTRLAGQMYAGRGLCWEETTRDLDLVIGGPVLAALAPPLSVVLQAGRWICAELVEAYLSALRELCQELSDDLGTSELPLGQVWYFAQGLFYGTGPRPVDAVTEEFRRRWSALFRLDSRPAGQDVTVDSAALAEDVQRLFPGGRPSWSDARLHSPDLQLCATSVDAMNRGDFFAVLGEMHLAWPTNACGVFVTGHPDPGALRAAYTADMGTGRLRPLLPTSWPRYTARLAFALGDPSDVLLGFLPAPGAEPGRTLPIGAMTVSVSDGELIAKGPDGRGWPLPEVFSRQLSEMAVDAFKLAGADRYTPRITVDRMVLARRTWRITAGECALATVVGDRERYLAARRWRRELGLPERVFVKIGSEVKPTFLDLSSPFYVDTFASMLRSARMAHGVQTPLTVSEMLPDTDLAWVPDAAGQRFVSELRLQIRDENVVVAS